MINFRAGAGTVVAADVKSTVAAVDEALLSGARMCVSVLEATQGTSVPVAQSQKVLRSIAAGLNAVVDGRGEIVSAVRQMNAIKARSNFAPESYGCPTGWDDLTAMEPTGSAKHPERA
jgi:hypothetical protein